MNSMKPKNWLLALLALAMVGAAPLAADPAPGHSRGHGHSHGHGHDHGPAEEVELPKTLEGLWSGIHRLHGELRTAVEAEALDKIHDLEPALAAHLLALPDLSPDLDRAERNRVNGQVSNLARALHRMHHSADAGNARVTKRHFDVFERTFDLLKGMYPESLARPDASAEAGKE